MSKTFRKIILSTTPPEEKYNLWLNNRILYYNYSGEWISVISALEGEVNAEIDTIKGYFSDGAAKNALSLGGIPAYRYIKIEDLLKAQWNVVSVGDGDVVNDISMNGLTVKLFKNTTAANKTDVDTLFTYFTNGSAKNAIKFDSKSIEWFASSAQLATLVESLNEVKEDYFNEIELSGESTEGNVITSIEKRGNKIVYKLGKYLSSDEIIEGGKIKSTYLPDYLLGQVLYGGVINEYSEATLSKAFKSKYNVSSDRLLISESDASKYEGVYFICTSDNLSIAPELNIVTGDWIISNGTSWDKIDNTDAVISVAGLTGTISASELRNALVDGTDYRWINSTNVSNWNTAYSWGNHAKAGYAVKSNSLAGYGIEDAYNKAEIDAFNLIINRSVSNIDNRITNVENLLIDPYFEILNVDELGVNKITVKGGTSSQFLKADGSLDSTAYLPLSGGTMNYNKGISFKHYSAYEGGGGWVLNMLNLYAQDATTELANCGAHGNDLNPLYLYFGIQSSYNGNNFRVYSNKVSFGDNTLLHSGNYSYQIGDYYLKTSGGVISTPNDVILTVQRTDNSAYTAIIYKHKDTELGRIGFSSVATPAFRDPVKESWYSLIHLGNIGKYALKNLGYIEDVLDADTLLKSGGAVIIPYFQQWNSQQIGSYRLGAIRMSSGTSESQLVLDHYYGNIKYRNYGESSWSDWKTIAFTDSDITGNARGLKGADGNVAATAVNGNLSLIGRIYWVDLDWYYISRYTETSGVPPFGKYKFYSGHIFECVAGQAMRINSSGNVTIGSEDKAGTDAKLYVDGGIVVGKNATIGVTDSNDKRLPALQLNNSNNTHNFLLGQYTAKEGYNTVIYGNEIRLCYSNAGTSSLTALLVNSSGNVTIGASDLAGTDYKLFVQDKAKFISDKNNLKLYTRINGAGIQVGRTTANYTGGYNGGLSYGEDDTILGYIAGVYNINVDTEKATYFFYGGPRDSAAIYVAHSNVGIGTNPYSVGAKLQVAGLAFASSLSSVVSVSLNRNPLNGSIYDSAKLALAIENSSSIITFNEYNADGSKIGIPLAFSHQGFVGIGTADPQYKLDVNGDLHISGNLILKNNQFSLQSIEGRLQNIESFLVEPYYEDLLVDTLGVKSINLNGVLIEDELTSIKNRLTALGG